MLIDISKIIVGNRIRKDFGNLQELADDISENTLLNPPVVAPNPDGTYILIAGERRLRAMRDILGYKQITVNVVSAQDDERALLMEISENECRKEFTKTERLDYARRLARIETAKAKERQTSGVNDPEGGRAREKVAQALGVGDKTLRREQFIEDNKDMVSLEDFEAWDEGCLSTNRVFQQIKAAQKQAERERDDIQLELNMAKKHRKVAQDEAIAAIDACELLKKEVDQLKQKEPEVVERTVEVVPEDYEQLRKRIEQLEHLEKVHSSDNQKLRNNLNETRKQLDQANELLGENDRKNNARRDIEQLTVATNSYLRNYGGKAWAFDQFYRVDEVTQEEFCKAIKNLAAFAQNLVEMIEDQNKLGSGE